MRGGAAARQVQRGVRQPELKLQFEQGKQSMHWAPPLFAQ
jgi:hypothetical protein